MRAVETGHIEWTATCSAGGSRQFLGHDLEASEAADVSTAQRVLLCIGYELTNDKSPARQAPRSGSLGDLPSFACSPLYQCAFSVLHALASRPSPSARRRNCLIADFSITGLPDCLLSSVRLLACSLQSEASSRASSSQASCACDSFSLISLSLIYLCVCACAARRYRELSYSANAASGAEVGTLDSDARVHWFLLPPAALPALCVPPHAPRPTGPIHDHNSPFVVLSWRRRTYLLYSYYSPKSVRTASRRRDCIDMAGTLSPGKRILGGAPARLSSPSL